MKIFIHQKLNKYKHNSRSITNNEVLAAKNVLFAIFSRYGDGIISFVVIKEFINKYPNKNYIVAVSRQQLPYAREVLKFNNITFISINKRNPLSFFKAINLLSKNNIDIAYNPWSRGEDSEFYLTFAKRFAFFRQIDNFDKEYNLYHRIRDYLGLQLPVAKDIIKPQFNNVKQIVIAPFSTDIKKNLNINQVNQLTNNLANIFINAKIIVAVSSEFRLKKFIGQKFIWTKSTKNSQQYLNLLNKTDMFVGVDSGPLHLSLALNIDSIAIFGATHPWTILDYHSKVLILRDKKLTHYFCQVRKCKNALCIGNVLKQDNLLDCKYQLVENIKYEQNTCPLEIK